MALGHSDLICRYLRDALEVSMQFSRVAVVTVVLHSPTRRNVRRTSDVLATYTSKPFRAQTKSELISFIKTLSDTIIHLTSLCFSGVIIRIQGQSTLKGTTGWFTCCIDHKKRWYHIPIISGVSHAFALSLERSVESVKAPLNLESHATLRMSLPTRGPSNRIFEHFRGFWKGCR
jgi:hypothetical protein